MGRTFNILIYILLITIQVSIVRANVQIDSVKCTPSACVNDGSMVVYANTNNPPLLYFINDGPLTTSLQSSNQFNSLMPGVYQVIAMDWTGSSDTQFALVQGNYVFPKFSYNIKNISCNNASDAAIFASPLSGKPPYSWKLTNQQTGLSTTLNVPTFSNLSAGDYVLAMTDHCQNTYIQQIHIAPTTTYTTINTGNNFHILDCNTVKFPLSFNTNVNPPIHYTIKTKSNTSTGVIASFTTAQYVTVSGISYGDTVQITAINSCNDTATQTIHVPEFKFLANVAIIQTSCTSQNTIVSLSIPNISNIDVAVSYTVKDSATGAVVLSGSANHFSSIPLNNLPLGKTYLFTVGDVCGNSSTGFFYLPSPGAVVTKLEEFPDYIHCMDSTAYFVVKYSGFYNAPKLTLLSGPPLIKSTKPKYAYTDNIQYNKTINPINGFMFRLKNLNAGTYTYRVFENSCGISITDSFQISPAQLSNDNYKVSFKKGCPGNNQIYLSLYTAKDTSVTKVTTGVFTVQSVGNSP